MLENRYLIFIAIILGLVEGLTEFLPISSTFHMVCIDCLLGFSNDDNNVKFFLSVVLQLGAILSVTVIFWNHCVMLVKTIYCRSSFCFSKRCLRCGHIILGSLPIVVMGSFFYDNIRNMFSVEYMFYGLISGGWLLLISEWFSEKYYFFYNKIISDINRLSYFQAFLIGCFQCLALFPGFSRSGATISGGLFIGVNRYVSTVFSFLLAMPVMLGATLLVLYKTFCSVFSVQYFVVCFLGFCTAFVISLCTVKIFVRIIQYTSFVPFAIYRFVLAVVMYFYIL